MFRVVTSVKIIQTTQIEGEQSRNKTLKFDFVNTLECTDSWRDFTNEGLVIVPKNVYIRNENNKLVPLSGTNMNIGGFSKTPLLMRGDRVQIDWGYRYYKNGKEILEGTLNEANGQHLFDGWISEVTSKKPIQFKCEDNFWKLKQIPAPLKTYKKTDTLEDILKDLLKGTGFTVNALTKTTFGEFRVGNETVAEVLGRLRKTYHFESYFRGNELRSGSTIYIESEANTHNFKFQHNIVSDELQYKRKDDIVLSIVASNKIEEETGGLTKDGHKKTKMHRIECLVTLRNGSDEPVVFVKKKNEDYPPNTGGERMTLQYPGAKSIDDLKNLATAEIKKYYYTGFKGKFTTFGLPFVKMGDNVQLIDSKLPERNGKYKVKGVEYKGGVDGLRQIIQIDYRIL